VEIKLMKRDEVLKELRALIVKRMQEDPLLRELNQKDTEEFIKAVINQGMEWMAEEIARKTRH
jgi:hypothetical protein